MVLKVSVYRVVPGLPTCGCLQSCQCVPSLILSQSLPPPPAIEIRITDFCPSCELVFSSHPVFPNSFSFCFTKFVKFPNDFTSQRVLFSPTGGWMVSHLSITFVLRQIFLLAHNFRISAEGCRNFCLLFCHPNESLLVVNWVCWTNI